MNEFLLYFFSGFAFLATSFLLFSRHVLYSVFGLVIVLVSLAGMFVVLDAEFVAVAQLMIYVGGIIILFIFAIMLTRASADGKLLSVRGRFFLSLLLGAGIFAFLFYLVFSVPEVSREPSGDNITLIGQKLLSDFLIPLEVIAILLLAVLVGALTIARGYYNQKPRRT